MCKPVGNVVQHSFNAPDMARAQITPIKCIHCNREFDPGLMTYHQELQGHICLDLRCIAWMEKMLALDRETVFIESFR